MGIFDWLFGGKKTNSSEEIKKKQDERRALEIKHQKLKEQVDILVNEFEKKMESVSKWYEIVKYRADFLLDSPEEDEQKTRSNYYKEECLTKFNDGNSNKDEVILNIEKFEIINTEAGNLYKSISEITVPNYPFRYEVTWLAKYHRASKASIAGEKMALKVINGEKEINGDESKNKDLPTDKNTLNVDSINDAFLLANKFQSGGDHNKAINIYTTVLNLIIKNDSENTEIQGSNFIEKNIEKGEVSIIPIDGVYFNLGSSYNVLKLYDKAKEAFEQAIKVNKDADALIHHHLGCTKIYLRDFSTSIADFDNALKKDSDYYNSYYMRAVAYASDGCEFNDRDKALSDVKKYLEYEPKDKAGNELLAALETNM